MKRLKIGIDIDNVIADSTPAYLERFNKFFKTDVKFEEITDFYHVEKNTQIEEKRVTEFFRSLHTEDFQLSLRPYKEVREILKNWVGRGFKIHLITGRPTKVAHLTEKWLKNHDLWFNGMKIDHSDYDIHDSDIEFKKESVKRHGIEVYIEDIREIAVTLSIPVLLIDKPWNQGKLPKNVRRVFNWREIDDFISDRF